MPLGNLHLLRLFSMQSLDENSKSSIDFNLASIYASTEQTCSVYTPILSKLLEKHICGLLAGQLQSSEPINESQFGFQQGKSTTTALLETTHNWLNLLESGRDVGAVFFDFKKAFDSVPHRALVDKLKHINLNPVLLRWILSYLSGRRQQVVVNGETSDQLPSCPVRRSPGFCYRSPLILDIY